MPARGPPPANVKVSYFAFGEKKKEKTWPRPLKLIPAIVVGVRAYTPARKDRRDRERDLSSSLQRGEEKKGTKI